MDVMIRPTPGGVEVAEAPPAFVVAEVSKNWPDPEAQAAADLLCGKFEAVINHNRRRGYVLHSFALNRIVTGTAEMPGMNETIIAVFRHRTVAADQ
jgi:hypothetical protein